ncbi:hypothetical protein IMSAG025_00174 [Muribaculaceae bacterium]|nr:hypothetical protein IMSAG025_00174 [Muribaculaceae bacterium]
MQETIKGSVYQRVLAGTVKANDLDKKALYNDYITTTAVDVAYLPYGSLDAKEYPVSSDELKKAYSEKKGLFRVDEETKDVSFISVSISASSADRAAARQLAQNTIKELRDSAGQLSKATKKEGVSMSHHAVRAADLPSGAVKEFVMNAPKDSVKLISETVQGFTVVRVGKRTEAVDSIQVNLVSAATEALGNKVLTALNSGLPADCQKHRIIDIPCSRCGITHYIKSGCLDGYVSLDNHEIPLFIAACSAQTEKHDCCNCCKRC